MMQEVGKGVTLKSDLGVVRRSQGCKPENVMTEYISYKIPSGCRGDGGRVEAGLPWEVVPTKGRQCLVGRWLQWTWREVIGFRMDLGHKPLRTWQLIKCGG